MILHLFNDEKVVNGAITYFDNVYPNKNRVIILIPRKNYICKYVKPAKNVYFVVYGSAKFWNCVGNVEQYRHIILHYLDDKKADFVNKINHSDITWVAWGGDLYNGLLAIRGYKLYNNENILNEARLISWKKKFFKPIYLYFKYKIYKSKLSAISKISHIGALECEYELFIKYFPEASHLTRKYFFYYPIDDILNLESVGENIMIGNSASPTGNHIDILNLMKDLRVNNTIYTPLSYGSIPYRKFVCQHALKLGLKNFIAITEFMQLDDYNKLLANCSYFIYGNLRQEAMGNIIVALYLGGKVFLDKSNPLYTYFKNLGCFVYSLDDLRSDCNALQQLSQDVKDHNRTLLRGKFSIERLYAEIKSSFPL
jgi:hypothetical protein